MLELSERIASDDFAQIARHPDFPNAFTRNRKLPLPALIGALLSMRNQSQQAMLDGFFASLCGTEGPLREVSARAFARARDRLHQPALVWLNDPVVRRADEAGLIERWCGLRVVAADASVLMPALRPCLLERSAANPDQRLFALYLPGAELTLHASVHSALVAERHCSPRPWNCSAPTMCWCSTVAIRPPGWWRCSSRTASASSCVATTTAAGSQASRSCARLRMKPG